MNMSPVAHATAQPGSGSSPSPRSSTANAALLEAATLVGLHVHRRRVGKREFLFRAGQRRHSLYLVHAGFFKTSFVTVDGREKITGFHLRGDLLGLEALDTPGYPCSAQALDTGEAWEIPCALLGFTECAEVAPTITAALAAEVRNDWDWMVMVSTLAAEHRVARFLLDLAARLQTLGFSDQHLLLRMTRADLGNYLALKQETVVRALGRLQCGGLIEVSRREIVIVNMEGLRRVADSGRLRSRASGQVHAGSSTAAPRTAPRRSASSAALASVSA